jgi:hypothetical protein
MNHLLAPWTGMHIMFQPKMEESSGSAFAVEMPEF